MTAHELASYLLRCPDLPVCINGWGSDEGLDDYEVSGACFARNDKVLWLGYNANSNYRSDKDGKWAMSEPRIEA